MNKFVDTLCVAAIAAAMAGSAVCAAGAGAPGAVAAEYRLSPRSDSRFAAELLRLNQPDLITAQEAAAKGTPAADLWKAQGIIVQWPELSKNRANAARATGEYVDAVGTYLDSQSAGIDGVWALDQAKFIIGRLAEPFISRMEYSGNNARDRAALRPLAALADRLLQQASISLAAGMRDAEKGGFNEPEYMRNYNATSEADYYGAWAGYFQAMAMDPDDAGRKKLLLDAAATLGTWADAKEDTGVNNQSLLLRGKALAEAGELDKAARDLAKANNAKAPEWVQYQARYQTVVVDLRKKDFATAHAHLQALAATLPANSPEARASTEMLAYRVAWAEAEAKQGPGKIQAEKDALGILAGIIQRDARYRDSIFDLLAAQLPDDPPLDGLQPMQQLAVAYTDSLGQSGDTPESKKQLQRAATAAAAVYNAPDATPAEKLEGSFLAGVCNAQLGNLADAARYNVTFAQLAPPSDPRAKGITDLAISQIADLRKAAGDAPISPELRELSERALMLSTAKFGQTQYRYAEARTLEDNGKLDAAAQSFAAIPPDDKNYLDAQFHLVSVATKKLDADSHAAPEKIKANAASLFEACDAFTKLLAAPPPSVPAEALVRAKTYMPDIWFIETGAALNPAVKDSVTALDRIARLDAIKGSLTSDQQGAILRYKVQAYQMAGQPDKAFDAVEQYAQGKGQDALEIIKGMAISSLDEINKVQQSDPAQARRLADYVSKLLVPIIEQSKKEGKADTVFEYQEIQADMLVRAGQPEEGRALALKLQAQRPADLRSFMTEARACFAIAEQTKSPKDYAYAKDYFERIQPRITPGVDSYWECWLRIIQCAAALNGEAAAPEIKKKLGDLEVLFGSKLGGEAFKNDFDELVKTYHP